MSILKRTEAEVDLSCLAHNFNEIKKHTDNAEIIAVVKADAYGHGVGRVAPLLEKLGASMLAVACLDEALELRRIGIRIPILILGATPIHFSNHLIDNDIVQSVHSRNYAKDLSDAAEKLGKTVSAHIKLDTGMSRFGIYAHEAAAEAAADEAFEITEMKGLSVEGIFTHFAEAENEDLSFTEEQFDSFSKVCDILKKRGKTFKFCHCANSAAVVNYKRAHLSCVRPGLLLYGLSPTGETLDGFDLRRVLSFKSIVADVRHLRAGDSVSYNRKFTAERDLTVAVICCGYADGLPRCLSNRGYFIINGKRAPVIGNICMDLTVVDVSDIPDIKPFDEVLIFGKEASADELAHLAGTISYELLTSISKRVPRTYID